MSHRYCLEVADEIGMDIEGEAVKVYELSFLGDIDRTTGVIRSKDSGCYGCSLSGKILIVERFRGSTVGTYVLYSLCKRGLAPKAIICAEPDPVIVAGAALCGIPMIYGLPQKFIQMVVTGDRVRIEKTSGGMVCVSIEKDSL